MQHRLKTLAFAFLTLLAPSLLAQDQPAEKTGAKPNTPFEQKWPSYRSAGDRIDVVTLAEPTVRHECKVKHFREDAVVCRGVHGAKPVTYKRSEVLALIETPTHQAFWTKVGFLIAGAGLVAASPFVPVGGVAVLLQVVGGISFFGSSLAFLDTSGDHDDDVVFYQRPGAVLQVALTSGK